MCICVFISFYQCVSYISVCVRVYNTIFLFLTDEFGWVFSYHKLDNQPILVLN